MDTLILEDKDLDTILIWCTEHKSELPSSPPVSLKNIKIKMKNVVSRDLPPTAKINMTITSKFSEPETYSLKGYGPEGKPVGECKISYYTMDKKNEIKEIADVISRLFQVSSPNIDMMCQNDFTIISQGKTTSHDAIQMMTSIHYFTMCFMAYYKPEVKEPSGLKRERKKRNSAREEKVSEFKSNEPAVIYFKEYITAVSQGKRSMTINGRTYKFAFTVRGHIRHYKSGNTVYVAPFKKGEGKMKDRTYKLKK